MSQSIDGNVFAVKPHMLKGNLIKSLETLAYFDSNYFWSLNFNKHKILEDQKLIYIGSAKVSRWLPARGGWGCPFNPRQGGTLKITPQKVDKPTTNHIPPYQFLYIYIQPLYTLAFSQTKIVSGTKLT